MALSVLVIMCVFLRKVHFKLQKISVRSQKLCLTIPKMLPDNKLSIISTHSNCQATFLGSFLRSQKLCLTINCPSSLLKPMSDNSSGISSEIPKIVPDRTWVELWAVNCQAQFLGTQKWCLTIVRQHFWDCQASFLGSHAYFLGTKRSQNKVTRIVSGHLKWFLYSPMSICAI